MPKLTTIKPDSPVYAANFYDPITARSRKISLLTRNKREAERRLATFITFLADNKWTGENPFIVKKREVIRQHKHGLDEILEAYKEALAAGRVRRRGRNKPVTDGHVRDSMKRLRTVITAGRIRSLAELTEEHVVATLDRMETSKQIRCRQSRKHHERVVKAFSAWLGRTKKTPTDNLGLLEVTEVEADDVVYPRGAFSLEQVQAIVRATEQGPQRRHLSGPLRARFWLGLAVTGLRCRELAVVRRRDFAADLSSVSIAAGFMKARKSAHVPIPAFYRPLIEPFLADLRPDDHLFPGAWRQLESGEWQTWGWLASGPVKLLRPDAKLVGVTVGKKGIATYGKALDCHSFRHFYITTIRKSGVSDGLAMRLARASSAAILTTYTEEEMEELYAAAEKFPVITLDAA